MRIGRLQLRDVKRYRDLQIDLAPGLTIIRGPNESGKSTIALAIELGLTGSVGTTEPASLKGLRSWDADPTARPTVVLDFTVDDVDPMVAGRSGTVEKAFGPGGTAKLTFDGTSTTDPATVDAELAVITGVPSPAFFRSTALVGRGELDALDATEATLRERLSASISAADRSTSSAIEELQRVIADLNVRGERDPGRLRVAEEAVARSEAIVDTGEAALVRLIADREALAGAEDARTAAVAELDERLGLLGQAVTGEVLNREQAAASERQGRYEQAVEAAAELARLHDAHPSPNPLPVVRQTVARLRTLDARISELKGMLSGEIQVDYEVAAAATTWRRTAIVALVMILAAISLGVAGQLLVEPAIVSLSSLGVAAGLGVMSLAGIGVGLLGLILAVIAVRQRKAARDFRRQKELAENEVERRLRGRSQMEAELRQAEADGSAQLLGLGLPDFAAAEDLLAREEAHVASIEEINARLEILVGREPAESFAASRDAAQREADQKADELAALDPEAREPEARVRFEAEVKDAQGRVDLARVAEAQARAQVDANTVDAEQLAGEAERLAMWREQLAELQRRARVYEAALGGLERAIASTMARATRYLERRMNGAVAQITDGRYRRVRIDDETLAISVVAPEKGDWVDVRELSDGTLGKVYLTARLGLIRYATGDRRPPIVLDDPFVTFDDAHAARAFALLRELTVDHRVIYLTATDRYDPAADTVVELPGPTAVDLGEGVGPAASS
ncbi:MAG: AAA family ATPase [Chloroflexota bacterium]|nr:AAA family ATPase [Chloroflexota bacterium]